MWEGIGGELEAETDNKICNTSVNEMLKVRHHIPPPLIALPPPRNLHIKNLAHALCQGRSQEGAGAHNGV